MGAALLECRVRRRPVYPRHCESQSVHTTRPLAAQRFRAHSTSGEREITGPRPPTPPGPQFSHLEGELLPVRAVHPGRTLLELPALLRAHESMGLEV